MNAVNRKPAIQRHHPADDIPEKPAPAAPAQEPDPARPALTVQAPSMAVPAPATPLQERLIEQHNVRIRPSTKERLGRAVDKLRYETGDRSISIASITDQALREYLDRNGC
ncbi:hypothetical protein [Nocardia niigatensis]|uniref:hypothetical protein n=1 Tax=Nocardia niigatensis TaxID=209249 RepID=UPI0003075AB8|nr:hypothetical protein [Nocardia niigatensis]